MRFAPAALLLAGLAGCFPQKPAPVVERTPRGSSSRPVAKPAPARPQPQPAAEGTYVAG